MEFQERLNSLLKNIEGAEGIALAGLDGISIESQSSGPDMTHIGAEYAVLLNDAKRAAMDLNLGEIQRFSVLTDRRHLHFSLLKSDYFLSIVVQNRGNWGETRYQLRRKVGDIEEEL